MKVCTVNDELGQSVACVLIERNEEIDGDFFRLLDNWGHSWAEGIISIIGPEASQFTEDISKEFAVHIQNYASKESKWITSSVPIKNNVFADAFCLQVITKKNCPGDIQGQLESAVKFESNSTGRIFKKQANAIVILDREFERARQDDAHFHLLNILRERINLEFAIYNGNIETLFFIHEIAMNAYGKIALVENSGGIVSYLERFLFNRQQRMNMEERFSYRTRLQNESNDFPKMIMDLKAHQSSTKSIKIYQDISQFFAQPLANVYDISDLCAQLFSSPFFYISTDQLFNILEIAMMRNETGLVEMIYSRFSQDDLDQREFATPLRLESLYISQMNSIKEESLADKAGLDDYVAEDFNEYVSTRLSKLIEDFESSLISTNWNPFANRYRNRTEGKYKADSRGLKESFETHDPEERLFCWALLFEFWDLANLIWLRSKYGIGLAILGANFLRGAAALKRRDITASERLEEFANYYENAAIDAYRDVHKGPLIGEKNLSPQMMLVTANERMGNMTMLKLAYAGKCVNFMAQVGVQEFLSNIWRGKFTLKQKLRSIAFCIFFFWLPFLPSMLLKFEGKYRDVHWFKKWIHTMRAPFTVFWLNIATYFVYLILFATFLLRKFCIIPTWLDWLLIAWTVTLIVEEIRQMVVANDSLQRGRFQKWWEDLYNKLDAASQLTFIAGTVLKLTAPETRYEGEQLCPTEITGQLYTSQVCFAFSFMFMAYRSLILFDCSRDLGPKVIMIWKMFFQMFQFLLIMGIFVLTYGIVQQSLQYPNENRMDFTIRNILFGPYYGIYGELFLGERTTYHFEDQPEDCIAPGDTVALNSTMPRCPSKAVISDIFHASYMVIANILLLNLLIALFSSTYAAIDENSIRIWKYSRYQSVKNNYFRPIFPPPFIFFSHVHNIFNYCKSGFRVDNNNSKFRYHDWSLIDPKIPSLLDDIEAEQTKIHIHGMKSFKRHEVDGPLTKTFFEKTFEKEINQRLDTMEHVLKKTIRSISSSDDH